jgi:GDPmannose 4,6-dehydratase
MQDQDARAKTGLITGITGQDGSYLAEFLLAKNYMVHGIIRRSSTFNTSRLDHLYSDPHDPTRCLFLHYGDLTDATGLRRILERVQPDEVYNLAAQSHVKVSFEQPEYTADVVALGTLRLIEAVRDYMSHANRSVRFYQAGSSEMFGAAPPPQTEQTPFLPRSPYAASKVAAYHYAVNYRDAYDLFICNGILFNHESPRRGETFVTRKITRAIGRILVGLQDNLYLGNLEAQRDWGYAGDYVEAMWLMLQQEQPGDYIVATGKTHSVKSFLEIAFNYVNLDWKQYVEIDPRYFRPTEVDILLGDANKAYEILGWQPTTSFEELVKMMVDHDLKLARQEQTLVSAGHVIHTFGRESI